MKNNITETDHQKRIALVTEYMLQNPTADCSLEHLAKVANYSPYHLQKIFKKTTGLTAKQFLIKLRLEQGLHSIIIYPEKSISEIAIESGFSSLAIFSRAMKGYLGISPVQIRNADKNEKNGLLNKIGRNFTIVQRIQSAVEIKRINTVKGIYLSVPFDSEKEIQKAFHLLLDVAEENNMRHPVFYGILTSHSMNVYKAFLAIEKGTQIPKGFPTAEIQGRKYASIKIKGACIDTIRSLHEVFHSWLPESGYKIGSPLELLELFDNTPAYTPYPDLHREILIPIVRQ